MGYDVKSGVGDSITTVNLYMLGNKIDCVLINLQAYLKAI